MKKRNKKQNLLNQVARGIDSDYSFMDKLNMNGWFWEIIRRSTEYKAKFNEFKLLAQQQESSGEIAIGELCRSIVKCALVDIEVGLEVNYQISDVDEWDDSLYLSAHLCDPISENRDYWAIPNPEIKYSEFEDCHKPVIGRRKIKFMPYDLIIGLEKSGEMAGHVRTYHDLLCAMSPDPIHPEETLYFGISKKTRPKDMDGEVIPYLRMVIEKFGTAPDRTKIRDDRWKYYLIIYDLKQNNSLGRLSYEDIAYVMCNAYKKVRIGKRTRMSADYFDKRNCENFYKGALALINGDYRKYLCM